MTTPKDRYSADRVGMVKFARHVSDVVSPPTMFAATGLALGVYERPILPGLAWGFVYGVFVSLLPILFVGYMMYSGRIGDLHMSDKGERQLPYLVAILTSLLGLGVLVLLDGPVLLQCLALFTFVQLGLLTLINTRWLISIHAAAAAATWLILSLVFGWVAGLILFPLVILVSFARLYLKRHTPAQVLGGILLGLSVVLIFRYFGCFVG